MPSYQVQLLHADEVEALRRLPITFALLGSEPSRPVADRVDGIEREAVALQHPNLELRLPLEYSNHHRTSRGESGCGLRNWRKLVKRHRTRDQDRRRRVDHSLGCGAAAPSLEARSAA